jgi:regulatory protein
LVDCTAHKLASHLRARARKANADSSEVEPWIAELIERYLGSGVLNDTRFATNLASQLGARGKSARAIAQKLSVRGVTADVTEQLLATRRTEQPGAELEAARAYARKRRLGPHRSADTREAYRHKDLASLARQGFSFDIAKQALAPVASGDDEF